LDFEVSKPQTLEDQVILVEPQVGAQENQNEPEIDSMEEIETSEQII